MDEDAAGHAVAVHAGTKMTEEWTHLTDALARHREPGKWVVAVGPTTVMSMLNMGAATEKLPSEAAWRHAEAAPHAPYHTDAEKSAWVYAKARATDAWNRAADTRRLLEAAVHALHLEEDAGTCRTTVGRVVQHMPTVRGLQCMAEGFASTHGATVCARSMCKRLAHVDLPSLHLEDACWCVVTLDFRTSWHVPVLDRAFVSHDAAHARSRAAVGPVASSRGARRASPHAKRRRSSAAGM
jgi:hypothetical protein